MLSTAFLALAFQAQPHITPASIDAVLAPAAHITDPRLVAVPMGLPLSAALFAGKPLWAVLSMCSEHRSGAGRPPGTPAPQLTEAQEKNRLMFFKLAARELNRQFPGTPVDDAFVLIGGWGLEFIKGMNAAAAKGEWSVAEFEDACRIIGLKAIRPAP